MILDVVAMLVAIMFMRRRVIVRGIEASELPGVDPAHFEQWKKRLLGVYGMVATASVVFLPLDVGCQWAIRRYVLVMEKPDPGAIALFRTLSLAEGALFFLWVAVLVVAVIRFLGVSRFAREHGIDLDRRQAPAS